MPFILVFLFIAAVLGGMIFLGLKYGSGASGHGSLNAPGEINDLSDDDRGSCDGPE